MFESKHARGGLLFLLLALAGLGGCSSGGSGKSVITRKPEWSYDKYKRIAVLPARFADPRAREQANHLTAKLTEFLTNNGAFNVVEKERFRDLMKEQDFSKLADVANPDTALPEGAIEVAQVLIFPSITTFELKSTRQESRRPVYQYDRRGQVVRDRRGRPLVEREQVSYQYTNAARVSGTVRLVDAATGRTLLSHTVSNVGDEDSSWGNPPDRTPEDIATQAVDGIATEFYKRIAPTRMEVKFDSDMLFIALDYYDGKYDETNKIPWDADKILAVVRELPKSCDRNDFRLEVVAKQSRASLGSKSFTWSGSSGKRGESLEIPVSRLKETDETEFIAKLFAAGDDEPVLSHAFALVVPKERTKATKRTE